ncbi:uncharacterized protein LOC121467854 [Drosophila elegans]|uniref:uncharacterized protein LOC121467854 n=1 Tax=Drosophila elegans TaxID=30023 RepID=UPI001BC838C3|nr:uncharacterized protein LOC121467854 [Drosophila elegans]
MRLPIFIVIILTFAAGIKGQLIRHRGGAASGFFSRAAAYSLPTSIPVKGQQLPISSIGKALPIVYSGKVLPNPTPEENQQLSVSKKILTLSDTGTVLPITFSEKVLSSENIVPISASKRECAELISVPGGTILIPGLGGVLPIPGSKGAHMIPGCINMAHLPGQDGLLETAGHVALDSSQSSNGLSGGRTPGESKYEIIDLRS